MDKKDAKGCTSLECYFTLLCKWKSTGAARVFLLSPETVRVLDIDGEIELPPGNYIFIASGPNGVAFQPVAGYYIWICIDCCKGCSQQEFGVNYFVTDFNPAVFNAFAFKSQVDIKYSLDSAVDVIVGFLQSLGYSIPKPDLKTMSKGAFIYTSNYLESQLLQQTSEDRKAHGELKRRAAIVLMLAANSRLGPGGKPDTDSYSLYVLAYVQQNHPRQDEQWAPDPDGYKLSRPLCESIAHGIINGISK